MTDKEINKLIAEKIFNKSIMTERRPNGDSFIHLGNGLKSPIPDYVNDMEDAWMIVNKLKQEYQCYFILENGDLYDYECSFSRYNAEQKYIGESNSPSMAICKAALKMYGIDLL